MRFNGLDLNLLVALDQLLQRRHVSAVAQQLGLTQSAVSGALARLRDYFGDELLVRDGRRMILTARARQLAPAVGGVLLQIRSTIATPAEFDPVTTARRFTIICSDYVAMTLVDRLIAVANREAPGAVIQLMTMDPHTGALFDEGEVDLLITVESYLAAGHPSRHLFDDEAVAVCWTDNERVGKTLTMEQFLHLGHVAAAFGDTQHPSFYEAQLAEIGITRRVEVFAPSFSVVPFAVAGTDRLALMHRRHAEFFAASLPLRLLKLPFDLAPAREMVQWHRHRGADPALEWLLGRLCTLAGDLAPAPADAI